MSTDARHALAGVLGHVDHGKTALVKALTGTDTDRLAEEKRRGISIALGFAQLALPEGRIDLIDMPGHERFVRTMVAGATGIDAALLVVAADEGVMPQTVEHIDIAGLIGVRRAVIAVSKCDVAASGQAERAAAEARRLVAEAGLGDAPAVFTSAVNRTGMDALVGRLRAWLAAPTARADHGFFYLPVDRVFTMPGFGTVATGTLRRGRIAVGDEVEIAPGCRHARVRGLQVHGRAIDAADPGRRLAVNLRGGDQTVLARGAALATPGMLALGRWLDVELRLLAAAPRPLTGGAALRILFGTMECGARLRLLDRDRLAPGESAVVQLHCETEVAVPAQEPFILRALSPLRTIGGGRILDPHASRHRRSDHSALRLLRVMARTAPAAAIAARLAAAGHCGQHLGALALRIGHAPDRVRRWAEMQGAAVFADGTLLDGAAYGALRRRAILLLDGLHRRHPMESGIPREALRRLMPGDLAGHIFAELIGRLAADGYVVQESGRIRARSFRPAAARVAADAALACAVEAAFRAGGLMPPDRDAVIGGDPRRQQALRRLARDGVLIIARDRVQKREIVFHRDAIAAALRAIAERLAGAEGFVVSEAGALLGISRKYSIPLVEHLDAMRFTRRIAERRFVAMRARSASVPAPYDAVNAKSPASATGK